MKNKRQEAILKLIREHNIDTQEALLAKLLDEGYRVTQATVSRDIRDLKLVKNMTDKGTYRYAVAAKGDSGIPVFSSALTDSIIRVDHSSCMLVIHTYPGMASALAACIDSMKLPPLLGCVAGDDTIIAVAADAQAAGDLAIKIRASVRSN